ncbi:MAG: glutamate racemase [Muribaculaceae bacterium]|nr:glutamate racemase [Muribaculaceae bacterium]
MKLSEIRTPGPIGVFDSGYGGLTILESIRRHMPEPDYLYLGDNARAPYGTRSFEVVYQFTLQAVQRLFELGCQLVILGCNTASAKALRSIQQLDLPHIAPERRVLGVIRPTVEAIGQYTRTGHIGIFGTPGTIRSKSYDMEIAKLYPGFVTVGQECPLWVPLVENREFDNPGTDYFVEKYIDTLLNRDRRIDTALLGCTPYHMLLRKIRKFMPPEVKINTQGDIVDKSL